MDSLMENYGLACCQSRSSVVPIIVQIRNKRLVVVRAAIGRHVHCTKCTLKRTMHDNLRRRKCMTRKFGG